MGRRSKRFREIDSSYDRQEKFSVKEAIAMLKKTKPVKFDQSLEVSLKLGVDPRKSDQQVRATVSLPNGTGKTLRILVLARGDKVQEALQAGAEFAGSEELVEKISGGWTDFDAVVATPEMMREVGKLGKVLGPRGLMPTPKAGTVTTDIAKAVQDLKGGKVEFKADRHGVVSSAIGKISFDDEKLFENLRAFYQAVMKAKPASAKGQFWLSMVLSSTMGPGVKLHRPDQEFGM